MKEQIEQLLADAGATQEDSDLWHLNGFRIKFQKTFVKWHRNESLDGLGIPASMFEKRGNFHTTKFTGSNIQQFELIIETLKKNKSPELQKIERREARRLKAARKDWLNKAAWCKGCKVTEQTESDKQCAKMRSYKGWISYCSDVDWWNTFWCKNAERVFDDNIFVGHFNCKLDGKRCPYSKGTMIFPQSEILKGQRNCPDWYPGAGFEHEVDK